MNPVTRTANPAGAVTCAMRSITPLSAIAARLTDGPPLSQRVASAACGVALPILRTVTRSGSPRKAKSPAPDSTGSPWAGLPDRLRARGLRWTPQRRVLVEVLSRTNGHVTGAELIERCRELDQDTIPSTV